MKHKLLWVGFLLFFLQASANALLVRPPSPDTPVPPFDNSAPPPPTVTPAPSTETVVPVTGTPPVTIPAPPTGTVVPATGTLTPTGPLAPRTVPEECTNEGFVFQNGQLLLNSQNSSVNPQLYMIHNNSDYEQLSITHPSNTPIAGAGQAQSRIDQGQWSALSVNQPNFVINCFGRKPGVAAFVDCKSVLQVCSYPKVNMSGGDHWIAENKPLLDTISSLQNKNVTMPK